MQLITKILILSIIVTFNYAKVIKPTFFENSIINAETVFVSMEAKNIYDVKLTIEKKSYPFYKNPFKENTFYALIPLSYYEKEGNKRVTISFLQNKRRVFKNYNIVVKEGNYKSELIKVNKSKIDLNKKDKKRAKLEYQEAIKIYKSQSKKLLWEEDFIMPLNTEITSEFGTKRVYNSKFKSYHSGIDFKANIRTPIIASNDGIVKLNKNRFYAGNSIIIDHGQGIFTCYFHLNKIFVKKGEKVKKGQIIGLSGKTGRVTGPHLHFATRIHGIIVEPKKLFTILNSLNNKE